MRKTGLRWRRLAGAGALLVAVIGLVAAARSARAADEGGGWLGVYTQNLTSGLREGMDYRGDGALVSGVVDGGPADEAGIRKGDVIVRFNNRLVDDANDLTDLVKAADAGQRVTLLVHRDGSNRTRNVTLGKRPADAEAPRARSWSWSDDGEDDSDSRSSPGGRVRIERDGDDADEEGMRVFRFRGKGDGPHVEGLEDLKGLKDLRIELPEAMGRGRLGVQIQDLNEGLGEYFDTDKGALVTRVVEGSAADAAGLKAGDVITRFDGKEVKDADDLMSAVRGAGEGPVDVSIVRRGQTQTLRPTLEKQRVRAWSWGDHDPQQLRELAERARERAERARERADRSRERTERVRGRELRGQEQDVRDEMQRLREELRELERRLERLQEDGE
jgi:membrane-associated protease RseP (regulator of RpoE activity)